MKVRANHFIDCDYLTQGKEYKVLEYDDYNMASIVDDEGCTITILIPHNEKLFSQCAHIGGEWEIIRDAKEGN